MRRHFMTIGALVLGAATLHGSPRLAVTIISRHTGIDPYPYVVAETVSAGSRTASRTFFQVQGATLSLQLPDGRIAVVNCQSKLNWGLSGVLYPWRSCREPLGNDLQAEFDGDKATLRWPARINSKQIERETYRVLGIVARR